MSEFFRDIITMLRKKLDCSSYTMRCSV